MQRMVALLVIFALASDSMHAQSRLQITPLPEAPRPNLVRNSSFEQVSNGVPVGWIWDKRNTDATMEVVSAPGTTGSYCLRFTSGTPFAPEVYALLRYEGGVSVEPNTVYTLSYRYKTRSESAGFVGGGALWRVRAFFQDTEGEWRRNTLTFATRPDETNFDLVIVIEAPTEEVLLDDIKLEKGSSATPYVPEEAVKEPFFVLADLPSRVYLSERRWQAGFDLYTPTPLKNAQLTLQLGTQRLSQRVNLPEGYSRVEFTLNEPRSANTVFRVELSGSGTMPSVSAERSLQFFTRRLAEGRLRALSRQVPAWQRQMNTLAKQGQDLAYPQATFTILQEFIRYVGEDLRKGQIERAYAQLDEMERLAGQLSEMLARAKQGTRLPTVPRYVTSPVSIQGASLNADTLNPLTGERTRRPVFFVGFGHFGQVRADIEKFPQMGFNLIQIERGVWDFLPEQGKTSLKALEEDLLPVYQRASRANVKIDHLLSPHYMPEWVFQAYPHLRQERQGFIRYSLFSPDSLTVLRDYLNLLLPPLKDQPALMSICLSNEPTNVESPNSPLHQQAWREWLKARHRTLITLNARWGTNYTDWNEIPIPTEGVPYADWVEFNADALANWHRELSEIVRAHLPDTPKHAKLMNWTFLNDRELYQGVDPERFAEFCELNGNDAFISYFHNKSNQWAFEWIRTFMAYDLQRSLRDAPLFNSEHHIIPDRERRYVPPQHARAVLWESAIRGLSATTFWVWERTDDPQSDFAGSLLHRPEIVNALAHTTLDLNRLAPYISALQNQPFDVYLLHARRDLLLRGAEVILPRDSLYVALTMLGVRVGFVTERQLEERRLPSQAMRILIPNVQYLSDSAILALDTYRQNRGLMLLGIGEPLLTLDSYGRRRTARVPVQTIDRNIEVAPQQLHRRLHNLLLTWGMRRPLVLLKPDSDEPAWGVAYRTAQYEDTFIASLCNYTQEPITVRLEDAQGNPIRAVNLLNGTQVEEQITLQPLEPVLIQWK